MTKKNNLSEICRYYNNNQDLVTGFFSCGFLNEDEKVNLLGTLLQKAKKGKALDLGCGNGEVIPLLERIGYNNYLGIDISSFAIERAKNKFPNSNFIHDDIHNTQNILKSSIWDLVLICDVLEHSPNPRKLVFNANNLLRVGGAILIVIPNYFNFMGIRKKLKEIGTYEPNTWAPFCNERPELHESFLTSFQIRKMLKKNSFRIIKSYGWDFITALSLRPPYAENGLKGFWGKNGGIYGRLNRFFMTKTRFISHLFSMYYIVSAIKVNKNDRSTNK